MTAIPRETSGFHHAVDASQVRQLGWHAVFQDTYTFENFFHPFVGELIAQLNSTLSPNVCRRAVRSIFSSKAAHTFLRKRLHTEATANEIKVKYFDKTIDVTLGGPYANYNWELLYHIPIAVAVHLSKTQRFAEAQKWFHYVFDPTTTDTTDIKDNPTKRYWRFLGFRQGFGLRLMSSVNDLSDMPTDGKNLIIVADVQNVLHFRIFDADGKRVVDTDENQLRDKASQIADLKSLLNNLWGVPQLSQSDNYRVITAVASIVGLSLPQESVVRNIEMLLVLLSKSELTPAERDAKTWVLESYEKIQKDPFKPHLVASTRPVAYQYYVVMKYLDNLIAWGDSLFLQDTIETINEATLCYVLAANLLGPRPQRVPPRGTVARQNFKQLKAAKLDEMGNALVELEGQFPFNFTGSPTQDPSGRGPLFGIGRTLYFCIPPNAKLLNYWDTVADRLFKIRHCQNIQGIARQLPLFDPPIDPGMLVKAAAAGIDVGSIVSGLNQPLGPVRSPMMIQKALELCSEVRSLGNALLSAWEKGDAEKLASLRQGHELALHKATQDTRFLQWKQTEESTNALLKTRATAARTLQVIT